VSSPSPAPDQAAGPQQRVPGQEDPSLVSRASRGRQAQVLALIVGGCAGLVSGIAIGNAARKKIDHWTHGY
jgi:hypothetical protein